MCLHHWHSALSAIFAQFNQAAAHLKKEETCVCLSVTIKEDTTVPVIFFFRGDHKSHQANTCPYGNLNSSVCITCKSSPVWNTDDLNKLIGSSIDGYDMMENIKNYQLLKEILVN